MASAYINDPVAAIMSGVTVGQRFKIFHKIGQGSFGELFEGEWVMQSVKRWLCALLSCVRSQGPGHRREGGSQDGRYPAVLCAAPRTVTVWSDVCRWCVPQEAKDTKYPQLFYEYRVYRTMADS